MLLTTKNIIRVIYLLSLFTLEGIKKWSAFFCGSENINQQEQVKLLLVVFVTIITYDDN